LILSYVSRFFYTYINVRQAAKETAKQMIAEKAYWENNAALTMADKLNTLIIDEITVLSN